MLYMFSVFATILNYFLVTEVRYILKSLSRHTIPIVFVIHFGLNLFGMLCVCLCVYIYSYSFSSLSYDRSEASSKGSSLHSTI